MFLEIKIRKDGTEKWVNADKFFSYMIERYSKVTYKGKSIDPYPDRVNKFYNDIPRELIDMWAKAYPNVDIKGECEKARAWLLTNTNKAKKDFKRFTNNWLSRAMENGGNIPVQLDVKIEQQIKKQKEYIKNAEIDSAPQDWVKDLLKKTRENMSK